MTTPRHVRTAAARLTGCVEERSGAVSSFLVADRELARLADGALTFWLGPEQTERRRPDLPTASVVTAAAGVPGLQVGLDEVNGMQVNALLTAAWEFHAPAELRRPPVVETDEADGEALPGNLGRPATTALQHAGLVTLEAVARHGRDATGRLHGIGPRVLRLLDEALAAAGLDWS